MIEPNASHVQTLERLKELSILYHFAKENVLIAETVIEKFPIQPINEIRNSYDHVMRAMKQGEFSEKDFMEAKEHLKRATLDSIELIAIAKFESFEVAYSQLNFSSLSPNESNELLKIIKSIDRTKHEFARLRKDRNEEDDLLVIQKYRKLLDSLCEDIDNFNETHNRNFLPNKLDKEKASTASILIAGMLIGLFGSAIISAILYFFNHHV